MNDFYKRLFDLNPQNNNKIATIVEGNHFGSKAIISDGTMLYESEVGAFTEKIQMSLLNDSKTGLQTIEEQKIFSETIGSEKKLVICGGGHISIPIIEIGSILGFHITVIEDRLQYANNVRRTKANEVICNDFGKALQGIIGDSDTYFVIVTRGHRYDQVCLEEIIQKENAYIGMIGSKVRVKQVKESLIEKGFEKDKLDKINTPIGLRIGAETPEEIAVSIMAEIIQIKNELKKNGGFSKEIRKAILDEDSKDTSKILATIIHRKGSAPREVGTKMIIYIDGRTIGTIGGGCVEAEICNKARYQLMQGDKESKVYTVDMTGQNAEDEGMVCGGIVDILLEVL